jgi:Glycosyl hydrolases family 25
VTFALDYALVDGNAPPDFTAARAAGAGIIGIRGAWGYRGASATDPTLRRDQVAARAAGCQVFGYVFLDYQTPWQPQCDALAAGYKRLPGDLPVALDLEVDNVPPGCTPASMVAEAESALQYLQGLYGQHSVMVYTSQEQWQDHFGNLDSAILGSVPLWLKTPYAWNARNPPHLDDVGPMLRTKDIPRPWMRPGSPGIFLRQFQGDAVGFPGFSSTVDISLFLELLPTPTDPRQAWLAARCKELCDSTDVAVLQASVGLVADGICGPRTFAALCCE